MAEAQRLQQADVSGKQFEFGVRESREVAKMDRLSAQISGAEARQAQANADKTRAITGAVGGLVSTVGSMYSAGVFDKKPPPPPPPPAPPLTNLVTNSNINNTVSREEMRNSMGVQGK